jgi:hypothetical protein
MNPASQTLVGVVNCLQSPQFPVTAFKLFVWVRWCAGRGQFTQRVRLLTTDEVTVLRESDCTFQLADENVSVTNITLFGGVQFEKPGVYWVEVHLDTVLKIHFPFPVLQIKPPPAPAVND